MSLVYDAPYTLESPSWVEPNRECPICSVKLMFGHVNPKNGQAAPLVAEDVHDIIMAVCIP